jgi:hypothetical protein
MDRSATHAGVSGAGFHTRASGRSPIKKAGYEVFAGSPAVAATAAAISPPPLREDIELLVDALTLASTTQHEQGRFAVRCGAVRCGGVGCESGVWLSK